jgi:hypothetical protein
MNKLNLACAAVVLALAMAAQASAAATPVGPLPHGPVASTSSRPGLLVAVALPPVQSSRGYVWRLARRFDSTVVEQVTEADVGRSVVLVFRVVGRGDTSLVFAVTRGDASSKALRALTYKVHSA